MKPQITPYKKHLTDKEIDQREQKKRAIVYSTEKIKKMLDDINHGFVSDMNPFYMGDIDFRDANIIYHLTDEELGEWAKCSADCEYFVSHYVPFENDKGVTLVTLRDYQKEYLHKLSDEYFDKDLGEFIPQHRFVISMQSRQMGKCITGNTGITVADRFAGAIIERNRSKYGFGKFLSAIKNKLFKGKAKCVR